ncbi:MAG: hypothetical protein CSB47_07615 [Proteobacteria bacterium]|nr:MAG: hypothetical protein CSB47_07615 [Pseudomonadota bacterium]
MQRLLIVQIGLVLCAAIASSYYAGSDAVLAALYGGVVAMANTVLLSRRLESAGSMAADNPNAGTLTLYVGVVQRFVLTLVMFGIGIGLLKLNPIAMLGAFAAAQLGFVICGSSQKKD